MVSGTLIDAGCLAALYVLVRQEGLSLFDLLQTDRRRIGREMLVGFAVVVALVPVLAVNAVLTAAFYGSQSPPQVALVRLPLWASIYSLALIAGCHSPLRGGSGSGSTIR
jgi:uncharacterized protein